MSIHHLLQLTPDENTRLLTLIYDHYMQPFKVVSVQSRLDQKEVVIQLRSGIRKTYQIHNNGVIRLKRV